MVHCKKPKQKHWLQNQILYIKKKLLSFKFKFVIPFEMKQFCFMKYVEGICFWSRCISQICCMLCPDFLECAVNIIQKEKKIFEKHWILVTYLLNLKK